jgi:Rrf2 family protein
MIITRKIDYGFRALSYIASHGTRKRCSIHEIARAETVPQKFLSTVLKELVQAKILVSHQGPRGGYQLRKPASKISFLDVINALGGEVQVNACTSQPSRCNRKKCKFRPYWLKIQRELDSALRALKISDAV